MAFTAEISNANQKKIAEAIRTTVDWRITHVEIEAIAEKLNNRLRGWINYFGLYGKASLRKTLLCLERRLLKWVQNNYITEGLNTLLLWLIVFLPILCTTTTGLNNNGNTFKPI